MSLSFGSKMFRTEAWHKNVVTDCIYSINLGSRWGLVVCLVFLLGFFFSELLYNLKKGFEGFCPQYELMLLSI